MPALTLRAGTKVPADFWGKGGTVHYSVHGREVEFTFPKSGEGEMLVLNGELVTGVLDKAVYGKFGLVHAVQVHRSPITALCATGDINSCHCSTITRLVGSTSACSGIL